MGGHDDVGIAEAQLDARHVGEALAEEHEPLDGRPFGREPGGVEHEDSRSVGKGGGCRTRGRRRVEGQPDERPPWGRGEGWGR